MKISTEKDEGDCKHLFREFSQNGVGVCIGINPKGVAGNPDDVVSFCLFEGYCWDESEGLASIKMTTDEAELLAIELIKAKVEAEGIPVEEHYKDMVKDISKDELFKLLNAYYETNPKLFLEVTEEMVETK